MNTLPIESLELQALEQRNRLHKTTDELKTKIAAAREKLDVSRNAREHLIKASIVLSLVGLLSGYGLAGMFTTD
ncbi:MAG: hypothetical protein DMG80_07965 [Acidobacteria bacterium]|jgi:hypothetical protein|nr:MAG: hypothetical protein DMG80_07965 [Acidobacteriota bacterium]